MQRGAVVDVHAAARLGMLPRLRELVSADPELVHARGGDGQTPLHFASTIAAAEFLLDHGADIDARDIDHESTPAQYMVQDRPDVLRYLIQRGCRTDIFMAAALGDAQLAARNNNLAAVRLMLEAGLPADATGQHDGTPLHWACFHGNAGMARRLLRFHPPLETLDRDFQAAPLGWAIHGSEHGWYCRTGD